VGQRAISDPLASMEAASHWPIGRTSLPSSGALRLGALAGNRQRARCKRVPMHSCPCILSLAAGATPWPAVSGSVAVSAGRWFPDEKPGEVARAEHATSVSERSGAWRYNDKVVAVQTYFIKARGFSR
jgi:hypothetical protein